MKVQTSIKAGDVIQVPIQGQGQANQNLVKVEDFGVNLNTAAGNVFNIALH
jgi:hypothetical protein